MKYLCRLAISILLFSASNTLFAQDLAEVYREKGLELESDGVHIKDHYFVSFKEPTAGASYIVQPPDLSTVGAEQVPFGEPSTGQDKSEIENRLNLNGEVLSIYDAMNAIYVRISAEDAERLRADPRVQYVEQDQIGHTQTVQSNPGWALDRIDSATPLPGDNAYHYTHTGSGRTIYFLDTGLNVGTAPITAEFGTRASVIYDVNGGTGNDCFDHGTAVSSVAAGTQYGVAKGATVIMGKVTDLCTDSWQVNTVVNALNWLTTYAPAGSIINISLGVRAGSGYPPCTPAYSLTLDDAVFDAHQTGKMVIVAAGNDGCNTADFSLTVTPQAFVVGATMNTNTNDEKAWFSRTGTNISTWAPGYLVNAMDPAGNPGTYTGTSFSAPMVAGIAAIVCEANGTLCDTTPVATLYNTFRSTGALGTVTEVFGSPLIGATSRFIWQQ